MHERCRIAVFLLLLASGCAAETAPDSAADEFEDAEADDVEFAEGRTDGFCGAVTASLQEHVAAGRAFTFRPPFFFFQRVTTYHARGSNEFMGLNRVRNATLYEYEPGKFSVWPWRCRRNVPVGATIPAPGGDVPAGTRSAGCGLPPPAVRASQTLVVDGVSRTYILSLPRSYDPSRAYPVVFGFHGLGSSAAQAQAYFGLQQAAESEAILVYPDAQPSTRAWGITSGPAQPDIAFFDALVDSVQRTLCVDQGRIFATGHSAGAFFTNTLGCARGRVLRGVAPVAGGGPFVDCDGGKVAALLFAARDDSVVPAASGEASRDHWLRANSCEASSDPVAPASCVAYDGCDAANPVHWCLEPSGGHAWPSHAGTSIWSFFRGL